MGERTVVRLGDVCDIVSGTTPSSTKQEYWDGGLPWVTPAEISDDSHIITDTQRTLTEAGVLSKKLPLLPKGTVLLSSRAPIGKVAIAGRDMYCNQGFKNLICSDAIFNEYLYCFLKSQSERLQHMGHGATFKELSKKTLADMMIPVPSLDMQHEIVSTLEALSRLIAVSKQMLVKADELIQSRFVEMFGDPAENSLVWPKLPLASLGDVNRGVSKHRPRNAPELLNGPYPLIQTGDVANAQLYIREYSSTYSEFGLLQSRMQKKGTLCITIAANIAQTAILDFDACFPDSVVGFVPNGRANVIFMHYWFSFSQELIEQQASESAQKNINLKILRSLDVIVPPLALQNEFAEFVTQVESLKTTTRQQLDRLSTLYDSLAQRYFAE